jgi:hypothetical protein
MHASRLAIGDWTATAAYKTGRSDC